MNALPTISVQVDLNEVPQPSAIASEGDKRSFERSLRRAKRSSQAEESAPAGERVDSRNPEVPVSDAEATGIDSKVGRNTKAAGAAGAAGAGGAAGAELSSEQGHPDAARTVVSQSAASGTGTIQEEGSGRLSTPGKGSDSSSTFSSSVGEGAGAVSGKKSESVSHAPALSVFARASTQGGTGSAGAAGNQGAGRIAVEFGDGARETRRAAPATRSSFRGYDAKALELSEKMRDSIFKQVAMKLVPNGGHMLVRLDPPQLGQIDIHMVVEKGTVVHLSLGAERAEIAGMLEKHLPELKQHLIDQGLGVENSEVFTRDFAEQPHAHNNRSFGRHGDRMESEEPEFLNNQTLPAGYITADGLDFWV